MLFLIIISLVLRDWVELVTTHGLKRCRQSLQNLAIHSHRNRGVILEGGFQKVVDFNRLVSRRHSDVLYLPSFVLATHAHLLWYHPAEADEISGRGCRLEQLVGFNSVHQPKKAWTKCVVQKVLVERLKTEDAGDLIPLVGGDDVVLRKIDEVVQKVSKLVVFFHFWELYLDHRMIEVIIIDEASICANKSLPNSAGVCILNQHRPLLHFTLLWKHLLQLF